MSMRAYVNHEHEPVDGLRPITFELHSDCGCDHPAKSVYVEPSWITASPRAMADGWKFGPARRIGPCCSGKLQQKDLFDED